MRAVCDHRCHLRKDLRIRLLIFVVNTRQAGIQANKIFLIRCKEQLISILPPPQLAGQFVQLKRLSIAFKARVASNELLFNSATDIFWLGKNKFIQHMPHALWVCGRKNRT
jgi:hypothetical protein